MTEYVAPPNQTGLDLNSGDFLEVSAGGTATQTRINDGGLLQGLRWRHRRRYEDRWRRHLRCLFRRHGYHHEN